MNRRSSSRLPVYTGVENQFPDGEFVTARAFAMRIISTFVFFRNGIVLFNPVMLKQRQYLPLQEALIAREKWIPKY